MRAVTLDYDSRALTERDVPEPALDRDDDVLIRIREAGVCGTDRELAAFHFGYPPSGSPYMIIGHEAVAEVVRTGRNARSFSPGDIVVPMVRRSCDPPCAQCARGRRDLCLTGKYSERGIFGLHGYFAEFAVDRAADLIPVSHASAEFAVLTEPLSVVEKAAARTLALHQGEPERALVLGAGTIGLLTALVLRLRGLEVDVCSLEAPDSPRARLVQSCGARYLTRPDRKVDIVIEATGDPEAAVRGLDVLAPLGVLMVLGAAGAPAPLPLLDLIVGNRVVAGSVNAGPGAFADAVRDLALMPKSVLRSMVERVGFADYRASIAGPAPQAPKIVHQL